MEAIQAALARIDARTYGICETCGETISAARLTAMPTARRCVACQERLEHEGTGVAERVAWGRYTARAAGEVRAARWLSGRSPPPVDEVLNKATKVCA